MYSIRIELRGILFTKGGRVCVRFGESGGGGSAPTMSGWFRFSSDTNILF